MKQLVIGVGQIGSAVQAIIGCDGHDPARGIEASGQYDVLHICYPCHDKDEFIKTVWMHKAYFEASFVIIHSTVAVGTTSAIGDYAVHSPVRGVHPFLEEGIRTFAKFFGGKHAETASKLFELHGIRTICTEKPETTELMKLVDTTTYGVNILIEKEIKRLCDLYGVDFDIAYTLANKEYNAGYLKLGMPQYQKYILEHRTGEVGGHCVMPNVELFDSWMCDVVKTENENLKNV